MSETYEVAVTYRCGHMAILQVRAKDEEQELRRIASQILCSACEILRLEDEKRKHHKHHKHHRHEHELPTQIIFTETTMNPTEAGQIQEFTGVLAPTGSAFPSDVVVTVTPNDPSLASDVSVDSTGLIVTANYPAGWVESTTTPLSIAYSATSASNPAWSLSATITPSAPPPPPSTLPTSITFTQTE